MLFIQLTQIPNQEIETVLDGQYCTISVYWRQDHLYLDLAVNGEMLVEGKICQNGANVLQTKLRGFKGSLHFFDMDGENIPVWDKLNSRYVFVYLAEGEEMPELLKY